MTENQHDTRNRLLAAAEDLFADRGFTAVSIRDIAAEADVNVAAVNYHFHSKDNLYVEVLRHVMSAKRDRYVEVLKAGAGASSTDLESVLRSFFRVHFEDTFKHRSGANFLRLLVREIHEGHRLACPEMEGLIRPLWDRLAESVASAEPRLTPEQVVMVVGSLHGQLIHFTIRWHRRHTAGSDANAAEFVHSLFPTIAGDVDAYIDLAVDHITRFSAAGIRALIETDADHDDDIKETTT